MSEGLKAAARALAWIAAAPWIVSFAAKRAVIGPDRALEGSAQSLAWLPGLPGQYVRRAFLQFALDRCAPTATICYGVLFSRAGTRIDDHAYIGPRCDIGLAHIGRDALVASGVHIPSGGATHGHEDLSKPIREQQGTRTMVQIGEGCWVGSGAVVMADVGPETIVGAGAVVTTALPAGVMAAGVPARVLRTRGGVAPDQRPA